MKAAVFYGPQQDLQIEELDLDEVRENEVLVRTMASGVCHSDLHFIDGHYPLRPPAVLGHEAAGVVEAVGSAVRDFKPGDRVLACLAMFCGTCERCLKGQAYLCMQPPYRPRRESPLRKDGEPVAQLTGIGGYAERMLLHEHAVMRIDQPIEFDRAALIGCGVSTGLGAVLNTAKIEPGCTVAVFGAGGVGLAAIQGARIGGARMIIAVDIFESKLATARELGATHVVDSSSRDPVEAIRDLTGGGVDYSFEAIGLKAVAEQAFECLRPGGTATLIGMVPRGQKIELEGFDLLQERKMQGSYMGSTRFRVDMPRYIDFYLQGRLRLDEMITRRGRLEDVNEAFRAMKAGEVARSVLMFD